MRGRVRLDQWVGVVVVRKSGRRERFQSCFVLQFLAASSDVYFWAIFSVNECQIILSTASSTFMYYSYFSFCCLFKRLNIYIYI